MLEAQRALREPVYCFLLFGNKHNIVKLMLKYKKAIDSASIAFSNVLLLVFRPITNQVGKNSISSWYLSANLAVEDEVGVKISTFTVFSH